MANYPGTKLVGVAYKLRKKMQKFTVVRSRSPQNPVNVVISRCFAEDGKEMFQNVKRTSRAIVLLVNPIVLRRCRCRCRCRRRCLSSLVSAVHFDQLMSDEFEILLYNL